MISFTLKALNWCSGLKIYFKLLYRYFRLIPQCCLPSRTPKSRCLLPSEPVVLFGFDGLKLDSKRGQVAFKVAACHSSALASDAVQSSSCWELTLTTSSPPNLASAMRFSFRLHQRALLLSTFLRWSTSYHCSDTSTLPSKSLACYSTPLKSCLLFSLHLRLDFAPLTCQFGWIAVYY